MTETGLSPGPDPREARARKPRERWRRVPGARGYQASSRGRVRSVTRTLSDGRTAGGMLLAAAPDKDGYLCVTLSGRRVPVHVIVARTFIGPCPDGQEVLHGPGGQQDNAAASLRYGTHLENERDKRSFSPHLLAARPGDEVKGEEIEGEGKRTEEEIRTGVSRPYLIVTSVTDGRAGA
jgi:hypothetical protein